MLKRTFLACLLTLPFASSTEAQEPPKELRLTMKEGVYRTLERNLDITIEKISPKIEEANILTEEGAFDHEVFGSFKRLDSEEPLSARSRVSTGGLTSLKSKTYSLDAGVQGKTKIGTQYTFEVNDDWTADTLTGFEYEYVSFTGVTVKQPLLRDFGTTSNLQSLNIARKDREISIHQLKGTITGRIADFGFAYWDLVQARGELAARVQSQGLAQALVDVNRRKFEAGAVSALEVVQAEAAAATRKDDVIVASKTVRERENTLKSLMTDDVYALKDVEVVPQTERPDVTGPEPIDESIKEAVEKRPDYQEAKTTLERNNIIIKFAQNQKFPQIDLEASYGYNGLGTTFSKSFSGIEENPEWSLGVVFSYPLENRSAVGELRAARLEADQAVLRLKKVEQQIIIGLDEAIKDIEADARRVEEARTSVRLARESLSAEEKKLAAGRSTTLNVLDVQEDLARALSNEIAAISEYNKSLILYHREKGTLLEELGINFKETTGY